jgi:hypothetical protein
MPIFILDFSISDGLHLRHPQIMISTFHMPILIVANVDNADILFGFVKRMFAHAVQLTGPASLE